MLRCTEAWLVDSTPAVIRFHGQLLQLIIVPIPGPETLGWIGIGFYLGDDLMCRRAHC